jgi:tetratricopeptide (TPR) repeat protein
MKLSGTINLTLRLVVAGVLGVFAFRLASDSGPFGVFVAVFFGLVIFALFGIPFLQRAGDAVSRLFDPNDSQFRITPEYSVAEARAKVGKYQEAIDEYRKVIAEHPDDVYPHVRIADLAVTHLGDIKLGELELLTAFAKAEGEDTAGLVANRLADLYQNNFQDPTRALQVLEQLCAKLPGTNAAARAEERIRTLREFVAGREPPKRPTKIAHRTTDEETLRKRRGY